MSMLWLEWVVQSGCIIDFRQRGSVACRPFPYALPLDGMSNIRYGSLFSLQRLVDRSMHGPCLMLRVCPYKTHVLYIELRMSLKIVLRVRNKMSNVQQMSAWNLLHTSCSLAGFSRPARSLVASPNLSPSLQIPVQNLPQWKLVRVQADCIIIP